MEPEELVSAKIWVEEVLSGYEADIERRKIALHREFDSGFWLLRNERLGAALSDLISLALETLPDGCELYIAAGRTSAPVARVGAGQITLRWQVRDAEEGNSKPPAGNVVPLRPPTRVGEVDAAAVTNLCGAFAEAGWWLQLEATSTGREWVAQITGPM